MAVASTWYLRPPTEFDSQSIYLLTHPPRAARLAAFMEHVMSWREGLRPSLEGVLDGQSFANMMHLIGLAVCDNPRDADASRQNAFMRTAEGQEYQRQLFQNLQVHKQLMGTRRR